MNIHTQARTIQPKMGAGIRYPEVSRSGASEDRPRNAAVALARRAIASASLEELQFVLANDTRSVVFFDRCFLILHFRGQSWLSAASNEPSARLRTRFAQMAKELAHTLAEQTRPLLVAKDSQKAIESDGVSENTLAACRSFLQETGGDRLLIVPLVAKGIPLGHVVMEFYPRTECVEQQIHDLLDITPFLSAALLEKLILEKDSNVPRELGARPSAKRRMWRLNKYGRLAILVAGLLLTASLVPAPFTVGGEAEIVSDSTQFAFCRVDGVVKEVFVREGETVEPGMLLARLDSRELDFQTSAWTNQTKILDHEISRLVVEAADKPSVLAEKKIVEVRRQAALNELDFVNWKRRQLDIRAPIRGVVATRDLQSLIGKRYRAGEPFAEIVNPEQLQSAVYVPDARISYVSPGMPVDIYLNNAPTRATRLHVDYVAPMAEQAPHVGNVFRVTANIPPTEGLKVGMKGVGRIHVGTLPVWKLIRNRLAVMWNELSARF
ncbi:MAG: HlyD family secretion protein [Desulfomonilaceae bacterium]